MIFFFNVGTLTFILPFTLIIRYIALTQELILKTSKASNLAAITTLNLHGNGLSRLQHLSSLTGLQRLDVSFNELTKLDDIAHMVSMICAVH